MLPAPAAAVVFEGTRAHLGDGSAITAAGIDAHGPAFATEGPANAAIRLV
ncbi:MAG: hypothetical protein OXD30_06335 [Bryobacterales bacterium]|nr:hypothetical protein [Bryobacterales bacterium]